MTERTARVELRGAAIQAQGRTSTCARGQGRAAAVQPCSRVHTVQMAESLNASPQIAHPNPHLECGSPAACWVRTGCGGDRVRSSVSAAGATPAAPRFRSRSAPNQAQHLALSDAATERRIRARTSKQPAGQGSGRARAHSCAVDCEERKRRERAGQRTSAHAPGHGARHPQRACRGRTRSSHSGRGSTGECPWPWHILLKVPFNG